MRKVNHSTNGPQPGRNLPSNLIDLKFGKSSIKETKYVKFLGVLVDELLSWKYHINELYKNYLEQYDMM